MPQTTTSVDDKHPAPPSKEKINPTTPNAGSQKPFKNGKPPISKRAPPEKVDPADNDGAMPPLQSTGSPPVTVDPKYTSVVKALEKNAIAKQTPLKPNVKATKPSVPERQRKNESDNPPAYAEVETPPSATKPSVPERQRKSESDNPPAYAEVVETPPKTANGKVSTIKASSKPLPPQKPSAKSRHGSASDVPKSPPPAAAESEPLPTYATVRPPSPTTTPPQDVAESETQPTYALIGEHPLHGSRSPDIPAPPIPGQQKPILHDAPGTESAYDVLNPDSMQFCNEKDAPQPRSPVKTKESLAKSTLSPYDAPSVKSKSLPTQQQQYATPNSIAANNPTTGVSNTLPPSNAASIGTPYGVVNLSATNLSHGEDELRRSVNRTNSTSSDPAPSEANPVYQTLAENVEND